MQALRRILFGLLVMLIIASPVLAVLGGWVGGQHWPMKHLQVSAPFKFVSPKQVRDAVAIHLNKGFFAVDLSAINADLEKLQWVEKAEVRKQWPDTLVVSLKEFSPLATWNETSLVAEQGSIFAKPTGKLPVLPKFSGQAVQSDDMVVFYHAAQPMFQSVGLSITELAVSERNSWRIVLSDGLVLQVGRNDTGNRLTRFVELLPKIRREQQLKKLKHADLRYTNGFALIWADLPAPEAPIIQPNTMEENLT
jgi:cell division protein FtsQ